MTLPEYIEDVGQALATGRPESIARAAVSNPRVIPHPIETVCRTVNKKCEDIGRSTSNLYRFRNSSHTAATKPNLSAAIQQLLVSTNSSDVT